MTSPQYPTERRSTAFTPAPAQVAASSDDDVRRILNLPVLDRPHADLVNQMMGHVVKAGAPKNPDGTQFELRLEQAWAIAAYIQYGGFLAPIDVGGGKTLISLSIPHFAHTRGHQKMILLIPAPLAKQLTQTDIPWARERIHMSYRWFSLAGRSREARRAITSANRPGLYIVPYSLLSTEDGLETLRNIRPTLIIADEAHTLANESARSKRFWGVMHEITKDGLQYEFCALSGTLMRKGFHDLWQLARAALGSNAPIPLHRGNLEAWEAELGQGASGRLRAPTLDYLPAWAQAHYPGEKWDYDLSGQRVAYQRRFRSSPGVISSDAASTPAELHINTFEVPPGEVPATLQQAIQTLLDAGIKPNGEAVPTPMHTWHTANELASGFWNEPYWPQPTELPGDPSVNEDRTIRSKWFHEAQQVFNNACFAWTRRSPLGFDSLMEVANKILLGQTDEIPDEVVDLYLAMKALEAPDLIKRPSRPVWYSDYKLRHVVQQVKNLLPDFTPVWAYHKAVAQRLAELLKEEGIPTESVRPGFADTTNVTNPKKMDRVYILSEKRCCEGLNLQHFDTTIYAQVCRSGSRWHQMMGRTHRQGQRSPVVRNILVLTPGTDHETLGACLIEAADIYQRLGTDHKAVLAAWDPAPRVPPYELLRAKVPNLGSVDPSSAALYMSKFGTGG